MLYWLHAKDMAAQHAEADPHAHPFLVPLQKMLDEFVHHNIDVACTMIETAGRFLFLLPETHERMNNMAQVRVG